MMGNNKLNFIKLNFDESIQLFSPTCTSVEGNGNNNYYNTWFQIPTNITTIEELKESLKNEFKLRIGIDLFFKDYLLLPSISITFFELHRDHEPVRICPNGKPLFRSMDDSEIIPFSPPESSTPNINLCKNERGASHNFHDLDSENANDQKQCQDKQVIVDLGKEVVEVKTNFNEEEREVKAELGKDEEENPQFTSTVQSKTISAFDATNSTIIFGITNTTIDSFRGNTNGYSMLDSSQISSETEKQIEIVGEVPQTRQIRPQKRKIDWTGSASFSQPSSDNLEKIQGHSKKRISVDKSLRSLHQDLSIIDFSNTGSNTNDSANPSPSLEERDMGKKSGEDQQQILNIDGVQDKTAEASSVASIQEQLDDTKIKVEVSLVNKNKRKADELFSSENTEDESTPQKKRIVSNDFVGGIKINKKTETDAQSAKEGNWLPVPSLSSTDIPALSLIKFQYKVIGRDGDFFPVLIHVKVAGINEQYVYGQVFLEDGIPTNSSTIIIFEKNRIQNVQIKSMAQASLPTASTVGSNNFEL